MKIRIMKIEDFDEMYLLWKKVGLPVVDIESEKQLVNQMIKLNPSSNFIVIDEGKIIGTIFGVFNGKRGWIYHLAVHPLLQNKGIGSKLLHKSEQALKKEGANRILLGVQKFNSKALTFYKKLGYAKVDDAIWMGKNI